VPETQWRVPTSCKGYEKQIRDHGLCPTSLCDTCKELAAKDERLMVRRCLSTKPDNVAAVSPTRTTAQVTTTVPLAAPAIPRAGTEWTSEIAEMIEPKVIDELLSQVTRGGRRAKKMANEAPAALLSDASSWALSEIEEIVYGLQIEPGGKSSQVTSSQDRSGPDGLAPGGTELERMKLDSEMSNIVHGLEQPRVETQGKAIDDALIETQVVTVLSRKRSSMGDDHDSLHRMSRARYEDRLNDDESPCVGLTSSDSAIQVLSGRDIAAMLTTLEDDHHQITSTFGSASLTEGTITAHSPHTQQ